MRNEDLGALFERLAGGDLDALAAIYDTWSRELYAIALWRTGSAADAADAVQDVFVRLATTRADLRRVRRPRSYLLQIVHAAAIDRLRRQRDDAPLEHAAFVEATSPTSDPDRAADARRLSRELDELPGAQREVIYLHEVAGLSFREIAEITRVPTFTAASRYRLALSRLRARMGVA